MRYFTLHSNLLYVVYHPKVTWPLGTYGLIQSAQGCPDGGVTWHTGWRKFDTEDSRSQNAFSSGINTFIKGNTREVTPV